MRKIELSSWRRWVNSLFTRPNNTIRTKYIGKPKFECLEDRFVPATISGLAFNDFNSNGVFNTTTTQANASDGTYQTAIDVGVAGVVVTAYDSSNVAITSTTSTANGTYTLSDPALTAGLPYRVEFTGLPAGFSPGPIGPNSGSTVQYVTGGATNVDISLVNANQYSGNNPTIVSTLFAYGASSGGANSGNSVVMSIPYSAGGLTTLNSNSPASTTLAKFSDVGAVLGIATSRQTGMVYVSAYTKLHSGYGPAVGANSGNGSIYAIDPTTNTITTLVNLNQLFGANTAGVDFRAGYAAGNVPYDQDSVFTNGAYTDSTGSYTSWDAVGKTSLGGMAVSDDGSTLYVMNLANRSLYAIPLNLGRAVVASDVQSVSIPFNAPGATGTIGGTQAGDLQPFAVTFNNGKLYVGIVNSAESTQNKADLHAYVYQVNPQTLAFGSTPVFSIMDMTYSRDYSARYRPAGFANWNPWTPVYQNVSNTGLVYAQPMLTGIAFDAAGNMTLGFRDRAGDQGGNSTVANPASPGTVYETYPAGETLRAFGNLTSGWTLESNGKGPGGTPVGFGVSTGFGPGGGQFYQQDYFPGGGHGYVESGAVAQMPGFPDVVVASYDPFEVGNFRTGGLRFQNTLNGQIDKSYQLYAIDQSGTFGKANGVGGVALINTNAPIEIGNYVWNDTNSDGIQNAGELGIAGVTVNLVDGRGNTIATAVTDTNGNYLFSSAIGINTNSAKYGLNLLPNTTYTIKLDKTADYTTGPLTNLNATTAGVGGDQAVDSNGVVISSTDVEASVTTGNYGQNNHTFDFGFTAFNGLSLGNYVWNDTNNDGLVDNGETGIANVAVSLLDNTGTVVQTKTTNPQGYYLFTNLAAGQYQVRIDATNFTAGGTLVGYASSTGKNGSATGTYEPTTQGLGGDNSDHGTMQTTGVNAGAVLGSLVTLSVGGETTGQPVTPGIADPAADGNRDVTQDFGFFQPLSLGNFVWNDANNNGSFDTGEAGIGNVPVSLLDSANNVVATTKTDGSGNYLFTNLTTGTYHVQITPPAGYISSTGTNGSASGPFEPGVTGNQDNQDHGTTSGAVIVGADVVLTVSGTNPDSSGTANLRQDFGLFQPLSLGNFVWNDANNNGSFDAGEVGIANVPVSLLDSANNVVATTTTNGSGNYLFSNLTTGTYHVQITPPAGYISSTGTNGSASGPFEPGVTGNQDNQDHGTTNGAVIVGADVTLTVSGTNPDSTGTANLRQDFGLFQPLSLGNFVWNDANNDGLVNNGETGLANVSVSLLSNTGTLVATTTTSSTGYYLFTDLTAGQYQVRIDATNFTAGGTLSGFSSSTGTVGSATGTYEPATQGLGGDNSDHGTMQTTGVNAGAVLGSLVTLSVGGETTGQPVTPGIADPAADGNRDVSQDFGFFQPLSLGNFVWNDANNNGSFDTGEAGIGNVPVSLLDSANNVVATTKTDGSGNYLFTNLTTGTYHVQITPPAGYISSTGTNGSASGPFEPGVTGNQDNQDHGTTSGAVIVGGNVVLTVSGTNPDSAGTANLRQDFGLFQPLSLGNFVWNDANNDGIVDNGETGIPNVPVSLLDSSNNVVATTTTNGSGNYLFTNLTTGTYHVQITPPAGYISSTGTNGSASGPFEPGVTGNQDNQDHGTTNGAVIVGADVTLTVSGTNPDSSGTANLRQDFGLFQPLSLGNFVWNDANNNGSFDAGEAGIANVPVSLLDSANNVVATTTTNGSGNYLFSNLTTGTYHVQITPPAGYISSTGTNGSASGPFEPGVTGNQDNQDHGTTNGAVIVGGNVTLTAAGTNPDSSGTANLRQDFGLFQPLSLGNLVWNDANNNGSFDAGEAGIGNVPVSLLDSANNVVATTKTDGSGNYLFTNLTTGTYHVQITPPAGYISSTGTNGSASGPFEPGVTGNQDNQDHGTTNGAVIVGADVTLTVSGTNPDSSGTANLRQDFGLFQPLSLGNFVWNDANNNGSFDTGETGIANVAVSLLDSANNVVATTKTDGSGNYLFTNLTTGTYHVQITPPAGYISSTGTNGSASGPFEPGVTGNQDNQDHGTTSGAVIVGADVVLTVSGTNPDSSGTANLRQDFGLFQPLSLGNLVWNDANNNGSFDAGEAGIGNVPVSLLDSANNVVATTKTDGSGNYLFSNLTTGTYHVQITPPAGYISSTGTNGSASGPFEPGVTGNQDNQDHGTTSGAVIVGADVVLTASGTNPDSSGTANLRQDFGLFQPLSLGNFVWNDTNNNGVVDSGETSLPGVVVSLLDNTGTVVGTATTTSTGSYLFTNLAAGQYQVRIDASNFTAGGTLAGYVSSTGKNGSATGTFEPSTLGLGSDNGDHGTMQTTGVNAGAVLSNLVTLAVGGEATGQPATPGLPDNALDGNRDVTQDFGFFQPLSIGNFIWNDANNNGVVDSGETGIANVPVSLLDTANNVVATTTTNGSGNYLFNNLIPGTYHIQITPPANYISSTGTNGSATGAYEPGVNGTQDNQDHGTTSGSLVVGANVVLTASGSNPDSNGTANLRQDFGLFQPLSLGNFVFYDKNNDGVYNTGDTPLSGVSVQLKDSGGNAVGTQTTDANGNYLFTNLIPGTYSVSLTPINNLISSTGTAGSPIGAYEPVGVTGPDNSDHGTTSGTLIVATGIALGNPGDTVANPTDAGFSNKTIDFGLTDPIPLGQISGYVYLDPNVNGTKDPSERPIPGTIVTLTGTDLNGKPVTLTTTTDATGFYQFTNLLKGNYTITETQPTGLLYDGFDSVGSLGGTTPVKNTLAVALPIGGNGINYNFGEIPPAQVAGYVYEDLNQNNSFDPGEQGIPNVTINITGTAFAGTPLARPLTAADSKNGLSTTTDANGRWNFYGLPPGNYTVTEVQPTAYNTLFNSSADQSSLPVTVGGQFNDVFSDIVTPPNTVRGNLNFGEILPANQSPTKRSFFSSTTSGGNSAGGVGQAVGLNPSFPPPGSGTAASPTLVAVGSGPGQVPLVRVFNYTGGYQQNQFEAYESAYTGGVRVAVADVNGDGTSDIITGTEKGGGPRIRVFDGKTGTVLFDFFAYESTYRGGLFIAAADVNGDGKADLVVSADTGGGPRIRVFSGSDGAVLQDFFAFDPNLRTGVRVAAGDVNGDGKADIIATTGPGTQTTVSTFDGTNATLLNTFQPFGAFSGGAFVAAGNTSGGIKDNIIVTPDAGGGPVVAIFNGLTGTNVTAAFAYDNTSRMGVRIGAVDVNGDGFDDVIVAPGTGTPSQIKILNGTNLGQTIDSFYAFDTTFLGGAYVA